jgi:hypothetical protein
MALYDFVYLNTTTLAGYAAQVDGGLIAETKTRRLRKGNGGANFGLGSFGVKGEGSGEKERSQTFSDAPQAQFQRLLAAANADPDALGWVDVFEPDASFDQAQPGQIIAWECDLDIPQILRLVTRDGGASKMLQVYDSAIAGLDNGISLGPIDGSKLTPEQRAEIEKLKTLSAVAKSMLDGIADIPQVVVGVEKGTGWKVFGTLKSDHLVATDISAERLLIVGKVKRKLPAGEKRRIIDFPSFSDFSPDSPPPVFSDDQFVEGPAVELDILAIYR